MSWDQEFREIERGQVTNPIEARKLSESIARSRVEGRNVFLEILEDRHLWNEAGSTLQDLAIKLVNEQLDQSFSWLKTQDYACGGQKHRIATFEHNQTKILFQLIPGGTFTMGDVLEDLSLSVAVPQAVPQSEFQVKPFLLAVFPVTYENWILGGGRDDFESQSLNLPLEGCSFDTATGWLSSVGAGFRIPTEVEWEYACRAGTRYRFFWGEEDDDSYCWYGQNSGQSRHPLGEHTDKYNAFGLVDMLGNVMEWCDQVLDIDSGVKKLYQKSSSIRVHRGGAWFSPVSILCRCASRAQLDHGRTYPQMGLRLAHSLILQSPLP